MTKKRVKDKVIPDSAMQTADQSPSVAKCILSDNYFLLLFGITLLGFFLRLYRLGYQSIWLDEGASFGYIQDTFAGTWSKAIESSQAPLHMIILHFMDLFSSSEFSLRLPSVIFGTLTIPITYLMGKRLFGKEEGIISAFLLSISMMHLWYSQEARMYAQMVLFASLSLYLFYVAVHDNDKKIWVFYVIFSTLAFYSHYYAVFVFIPEVLFYLLFYVLIPAYKEKSLSLQDISSLKGFLLAMLALFISTLPLMVPFIQQAISRTSGTPTWGIGQSASFVPTMLVEFSTRVTLSSVLFILLFIIGLIIAGIRQKEQCAYLAIYIFIPLVASYILAASMPFSPRYLLFLLPAYLVFVSRGITGIADRLSPSKKIKVSSSNNTRNLILLSFVVLIFILTIPLLSQYYTTAQKEDWRSTAAYLSNLTQEGDAVVPLPNYMRQPLVYYYSNSSDNTILTTGYTNDVQSISSLSDQYERCWFLVTWDIAAANPDGTVLKWLDGNATFVNQVTGVYIFTSPKI
ncbi:glycosyltransferase family 39 protein [uncultured Methanomethylovorans sp.]|uniref:glycosyltransferase family 39 protein n=1 Tax=uncultured Methanomethylovorans sp. TaxID=183759 RepID=UPI002AA68C14|nr:glycosyltransferase family 39 protein [uncultured Methanomethylovorans sp.]